VRDVLELVGRSGDVDLVAALVRALGDAVAAVSDPLGASELVQALAPLASDPTSAPIAIAAVDALGRAPSDAPGRDEALARATDHDDAAVVRAALLKLAGSAHGPEPISRCLDHPSAEVRLLAAEMLSKLAHRPQSPVVAAEGGGAVRARLSQRVTVEPERDVREAIEEALAALHRRGGGAGAS
jgi:hypothetical protein